MGNLNWLVLLFVLWMNVTAATAFLCGALITCTSVTSSSSSVTLTADTTGTSISGDTSTYASADTTSISGVTSSSISVSTPSIFGITSTSSPVVTNSLSGAFSRSTNVALIVGLSVGLPMIVACTMVIAICVWYKKKYLPQIRINLREGNHKDRPTSPKDEVYRSRQ